MAERDIPSAYRYNDDHNPCVITNPVTFVGLTNATFNQIRQYGRSGVAVSIHLLEAIAVIATHTYRQKDRAALLHNDDHNPCVITNPVTFVGLTNATFNQIRQYGRSGVAVSIHLLEVIAVIATHTYRQKDRAALLHHACMIKDASHEGVTEECDRRMLRNTIRQR